ncbi:MAG: hypothetical protein IVW57_14285 [Ktedonobacterales bacterium]|nr:hypothetical protein [Ktedonobacterales bacterium]
MIIRNMTENQYRLDDEHMKHVHALDDQLVHAMDSDDHAAFETALTQLVTLLRDRGTLVPVDEVVPSDILIPAPDMTLAEAHHLLQEAEAHIHTPPEREP